MAESHKHHASHVRARDAAPAHVHAEGSAATPVAPQAHVNLERGRLSLIKGEHRWRFRWEPGSESSIISAVADLARNPDMNFDWFDAAVVCRHIAQGLPPRAAPGARPAHPPQATNEK